jgi:HTH-type transcriptional regulator, transcriptional repressor of NAD biosynthesis genes
VQWADGLVVGKFAPLHRGHEALVAFAQQHCARVRVLSYSNPEPPGCPPERRRAWLAERLPATENIVLDAAWLAQHRDRHGRPIAAMPHNDAPDAVHQAYLGYLLAEVLQWPVDAIFGSEDWLAPCAGVLSAALGRAVAPVAFDPRRRQHPVHGRDLRSDPHRHRDAMAAAVYADFVERVVLLGGESSGKSSLAAALAQHFGTRSVEEYGRELWLARSGELTLDDLRQIARTQVQREEAAARHSRRYLFCDTSPLTTLCYAQAMFGGEDAEIARLARRPYAHVLLCAPDFDFVQDGTRRDGAFRAWQHDWTTHWLDANAVRWTLLSGPLDARIATAAALLAAR